MSKYIKPQPPPSPDPLSLRNEPGVIERYLNRARTFNAKRAQETPVGEWELTPAVTYKTVTVTAQGSYLHCKVHKTPGGNQQKSPGGNRGIVQEFSAKSRKRLMDTFAKFDRKAMRGYSRVLFVTLTYPYLMTDENAAKGHLKAFMERLQYHHGGMWAVWKKEYQKSGSIHYHVMLGGVGYLPVNTPGKYDWNAAWTEIVGGNAANSVDIERMQSANGVMYYVAKYMSKEEKHQPLHSVIHGAQIGKASASSMSAPATKTLLGLSICHNFGTPIEPSQSPGRFWGVYGRANLPVAEKKQHSLQVTRQGYNDWLGAVDSDYCAVDRGWTVYTEYASRLAALLFDKATGESDYGWRVDHWNTIRHVRIQQSMPWSHLSGTEQKSHVMRLAQTWLHGADYDAPPD